MEVAEREIPYLLFLPRFPGISSNRLFSEAPWEEKNRGVLVSLHMHFLDHRDRRYRVGIGTGALSIYPS